MRAGWIEFGAVVSVWAFVFAALITIMAAINQYLWCRMVIEFFITLLPFPFGGLL